MTIKTDITVTQKQSVEKEIDLPYCCLHRTTFLTQQYLMVVSEQEVIAMQASENLVSVSVYPLHVWTEQITQAEPISREQYMAALDEALSRILDTKKKANAMRELS